MYNYENDTYIIIYTYKIYRVQLLERKTVVDKN